MESCHPPGPKYGDHEARIEYQYCEVPQFEDILPVSLGVWERERDEIIKQKKGEVSLTTALVQVIFREEVGKQGEKHVRALQEQTKAIQDLNKTLTDYFYNRRRQRGTTPLPDRPQTPVVSRFHDEHQITSTADK